MNEVQKLKLYIDALTLYDFREDAVFSSLYRLFLKADTPDAVQCYSELLRHLLTNTSLKTYLSQCILTSGNVFSEAAAAGKEATLPAVIHRAVQSDLAKLEAIASVTQEEIAAAVTDSEVKEILLSLPALPKGDALPPLTQHWETQTEKLVQYYRQNGYGIYAKHCAFTWRDRELVPMTAISTMRLTDLKNYERQRKQVVQNTVSFLQGLPANNILLYGDRGTGKSSTIHAVLNEYKKCGLRMIEISKSDIGDLTLIRERIAGSPMKFIIFIDDLSFDARDDAFGELKAALEGSLSGQQENSVIYATSNRRHLIKENFSDRENDMHRSDTMQEELSLSDRFGLCVNFLNPDKAEYLDITEKIARDRKMDVDLERLLLGAENWARRRGGRSPRCAKQFVDYVEACEKQGIEW